MMRDGDGSEAVVHFFTQFDLFILFHFGYALREAWHDGVRNGKSRMPRTSYESLLAQIKEGVQTLMEGFNCTLAFVQLMSSMNESISIPVLQRSKGPKRGVVIRNG